MFGGEVYQYVGDEIIVIWPIGKNNLKCIRSFFKMTEIIKRKKETYEIKYGICPEFKAGIHAGKVIVTSVGKQKREIAYHGDVLNTTSRIQGKCNELEEQLLISGDFMRYINLENHYIAEKKAEMALRGKTRKISLYGIRPAHNGN